MEPSEFRITTIVYDRQGNIQGSAEVIRDRVAKEGTGPVVTYTFDPHGDILRVARPDEQGFSPEESQ